MSHAIMTLLGLYKFDNTIFDLMQLPSDIDRDILINNILIESGEFSVLYPNPFFMKEQIGKWSLKWQRTFEKWMAALNFEYDPLYNYDRTEEWTDSGKNSGQNANWNNNSVTSNGNSTITDGSTTTNKVSAFDSSTLQNDTETGFTGSTQNYNTNTDTFTGNTSATNSGDFENEHKGRMYGNIGVTTSQALLREELDISAWNVYQHITDLFLNEFCIMVY